MFHLSEFSAKSENSTSFGVIMTTETIQELLTLVLKLSCLIKSANKFIFGLKVIFNRRFGILIR